MGTSSAGHRPSACRRRPPDAPAARPRSEEYVVGVHCKSVAPAWHRGQSSRPCYRSWRNCQSCGWSSTCMTTSPTPGGPATTPSSWACCETRSGRAPTPVSARLLQRRGTVGLPAMSRPVGAAISVRDPFGVAGSVLRPRDHRSRSDVRILRPAAAVSDHRMDETGLDRDSLQDAVRAAYQERPVWRALPEPRASERATIAAAHRAVYEAVLS